MGESWSNRVALAHRACEPEEKPWPVVVFAHDEESQIITCLESLAKGSMAHPIYVYVLANGCNDKTEAVVRDFILDSPWVTLVSVTLGDKANAWNVFVHDIAHRAEVYFFVDGDARVVPGSFDALYSALERSPEANAAAAIPAVGRSKKLLAQFVCEYGLILGNLYALRGDFVLKVKQSGARLPIGYIGEDGLVS